MTKKQSAQRVAIVGGVRTPFSKQLTDLKTFDPIELGKRVVVELIQRVDIPVADIEQLVFGAVVAMPQVPNIAREIAIGARLPNALDAYSVSRACATSLQAACNVAQAIQSGQIDTGIAGGADSSSILPIGVSRGLADALVKTTKAKTIGAKLQCFKGIRPKHLAPVPPAVKDYTTGLGMGQSAEQMARDNGISRQAQDEFAHRSHSLAAKAWADGLLNEEVMAVYQPDKGMSVVQDNVVRSDSTIESYAKLRPAFDRKYGTVTAGNSTPLSDGAAAVMLMSEEKAKALGLPILGFIKSMAFSAMDPYHNMLLGPSYATPKALDAAGLALGDIDLIDMHEAFAAQTLSNIQAFGSKTFAKEKLGRDKAIGEIDMDKFNIHGGSIAFGHPFAATGARLITQSLNSLKREQKQFGLITACAAGGLGAAFVLEAA